MIRAFSLAEAASWLGVEPVDGDRCFTGISTDTRSIQPGDLFVAIRGENFDGHKFIGAAEAAGAAGAVVESFVTGVAIPQLVVPDAILALARLARGNRLESRASVVAVTGSSGKTTVKEMLAGVLAQEGATLATQGNLNNHIGAPLTLFRLAPEHRFAVIELGASAMGEIAHTVSAALPDVAIITNAGEAHLEGFGSYQNIVLGKGEIIEGVVEGGTQVLNADDPACEQWRCRASGCRVVTVSRKREVAADYHASSNTSESGDQRLTVDGPDGWNCEVTLALAGEHNVTNALLTIAAVRSLGISDDAIRQGLATVLPAKGRLQPVVLAAGIEVIDDSYNANPSSMKAALGVLATRPGLRIAVLGAMAELGAESLRMHREVGERARSLGIDRLLAVGPGCEGYLEGFGEGAEPCTDQEEAVSRLIKQLDTPVTVMVKGSRSSAMDRVVEELKERVKNQCYSG